MRIRALLLSLSFVAVLVRVPLSAQQTMASSDSEERQLLLLRRTLLTQIESMQLSHLADDCVLIMFKPQEKMKTPDKSNWVAASSVKRCMETQEPFSFFGKSRHQCAYTGGVYVKDVMVKVIFEFFSTFAHKRLLRHSARLLNPSSSTKLKNAHR